MNSLSRGSSSSLVTPVTPQAIQDARSRCESSTLWSQCEDPARDEGTRRLSPRQIFRKVTRERGEARNFVGFPAPPSHEEYRILIRDGLRAVTRLSTGKPVCRTDGNDTSVPQAVKAFVLHWNAHSVSDPCDVTLRAFMCALPARKRQRY